MNVETVAKHTRTASNLRQKTGDRIGLRPARSAKAPRSIAVPSTVAPPAEHIERLRLEMEITALRARLTAKESALTALAAERDYYADLFNDSPAGDLMLDEIGNILEANDQAALILGLPSGSTVTGALGRFLRKRDMSEFMYHLRKCQAGQTVSTELQIVLGKGRTLPVELISTATLVKGQLRLRTLLVDMSERAATKAALVVAQENYRALLDSVQGIVWEADPRTLDVLFVSKSAERLLGYSRDFWYRPSFWANHIHISDRDRVISEVTKAIACGEGHHTVDYRVLDSERRTLWFRDTLTLLTVEGKPRLLGVAVDITDQKSLEKVLQETQNQLEHRVTERTAELSKAISELEAFSYSISHDLRAPLRAIEGYSNILQERAGRKLSAMEREFLTRMQNSARRMDTLIQDVLTYSRVARSPLELKPVDLEKLVRAVLNDYPGLQPPQATVDVQSPLKPVLGHEAFLTQCISNLLVNAAKFVQPGKKPHIHIRTETSHDQVEVIFQDNGFGIALEDQQRIFGIFQRLQRDPHIEGTGIGLAIVKKAVERMGGQVGVNSTPGEGSRFWLRLRAAQ